MDTRQHVSLDHRPAQRATPADILRRPPPAHGSGRHTHHIFASVPLLMRTACSISGVSPLNTSPTPTPALRWTPIGRRLHSFRGQPALQELKRRPATSSLSLPGPESTLMSLSLRTRPPNSWNSSASSRPKKYRGEFLISPPRVNRCGRGPIQGSECLRSGVPNSPRPPALFRRRGVGRYRGKPSEASRQARLYVRSRRCIQRPKNNRPRMQAWCGVAPRGCG